MSTNDTHRERSAEDRGVRKVREGLVVSDKMDKTVVVAVEDRVKHAALRQGRAPHEQAEGARRDQRRRHRRPRPDHGDPSAVSDQALAPGRDPREGQVTNPFRQLARARTADNQELT